MATLIPIIGLEIHVRLKTRSKMFCSCENIRDDAAPNTAICSVCTGQPGALPALNEEAIRLGVRAGLALGCTIPDTSHFDRKNYFYPDLPKGYQISQYDFPIAEKGELFIDVPGGKSPRDTVRIGITRAHLEEDAAKNVHDAKTKATLVDYNRSGTPLIEIVTEPDFRSPQEAKAFLQELQAILRCIGVSDADMEKGFMRCDANISLLPVDVNNLPTQHGLNPKIEIKNLNSFRSVERALAYEIDRQTRMHESGEMPAGATRGWDENIGQTFEQRLKETNADYRYFPEPDLPPLHLTDVREDEKLRIHELPRAMRSRLSEEWGFTSDDARTLVANEGWADYAEEVMGELGGWIEATDTTSESAGDILAKRKTALAKLASGWLTSKLGGLLAAQNRTLAESNITAENFAEFLHLVDDGTLNSTNAQKLLALMIETKADPSQLMEEHDLGQTSDPAIITDIVTRTIEQNPDQVKQILAGKLATIKWLVGCVMKATEGKMNPQSVEEEIKKQLGI